MLSKILQVLGVLISVAGLLGDERIFRWDRLSRAAIAEIFRIRILDREEIDGIEVEYIRRNWCKFYSNIAREGIGNLFQVFGDEFARHIYLVTGLFVSAVFWSVLYFKIYLNIYQTILGIVVAIIAWLFLPQIYVKWRIAKIVGKPRKISMLKAMLLWMDFIPDNLANLVYSFVASLLIPVLILVFILSPLVFVAEIIILVVFVAILKLFLLPYYVLDLIVGKLRIKSTVLLLGLSLELIGIIIQE
jgi:hypothetical protein